MLWIRYAFRYVMDSLVEVGNPVFQSLSTVAKISSGNITRAIKGIKDDVNIAVELNAEHIRLVNMTMQILGVNSTLYFGGILNSLASNLRNMTEILNNIEVAINEIKSQNSQSQEAVRALLPNNDIKALNAVLRQYILTGDAAIPQIRSIVSRVQSVDNFQDRISSTINQQRQYLSSTLARIIPYLQSNVISRFRSSLTGLQTQVVSRSSRAAVTLSNLVILQPNVLGASANQTIPVIQSLAQKVSNDANILLQQVSRLTVNEAMPYVLMNETEWLLEEASRNLTMSITQRLPFADTCYSRYNSDFDRIPRNAYSQAYTCVWDTASDLTTTALNMNYVVQLALVDLNNGLQAVERCTNMVSRTSPEMTVYQAASCLNDARSYLQKREVYAQQMANYQILLRNEISYSAQRYNFCMVTTLRQVMTQVSYLKASVDKCLNVGAVVSPYWWSGSVSIGFGSNGSRGANAGKTKGGKGGTKAGGKGSKAGRGGNKGKGGSSGKGGKSGGKSGRGGSGRGGSGRKG
ncbi:keratin, type II cytoskeletal 1-like [Wyeomyia smithii]|uniref:keratin, type II cytoskeletal 1-like n=1 Tax=Wyeomyia smithii TaxID=174621 RepID=UPI002467F954|nr:keratin, type II cytoskeletal 1-like [Wyeomyia smithii]